MTTNACTEPATQTSQREEEKRGFTLTEIAIVLGIIGLILGAIWVAASAVYSNYRISTAERQLVQVAQAVRVLYATAGSVDAVANITMGTPPSTTNAYVLANIFPGDMQTVNTSASTVTLTNPWGGSVGLQAATTSTTNDSFLVALDTVPINACISLTTTLTGQGINATLNNINLAAPGTNPTAVKWTAATNFPVTASTAAVGCNGAGTKGAATTSVAMGFIFRLKG